MPGRPSPTIFVTLFRAKRMRRGIATSNTIPRRDENIIRCFRWRDLKGWIAMLRTMRANDSRRMQARRLRTELHRRLFQLVYKLLPLASAW